MCSNREELKRVLKVIDCDYISCSDSKIQFKVDDKIVEINNNSSYHSSDGKNYLKCNFISDSTGTIVVSKHREDGDINIRCSNGVSSSNICFTFRCEDNEYCILFGKEKNNEDYFKISKSINNKMEYIVYRELNDNKSLNLFDNDKYLETTIILNESNLLVSFKNKQAGININPVNTPIILNRFDEVCGFLLNEKKELIKPILDMFKEYTNDFYFMSIEKYPIISKFKDLFYMYDEDYNKYSEEEKNKIFENIKILMR